MSRRPQYSINRNTQEQKPYQTSRASAPSARNAHSFYELPAAALGNLHQSFSMNTHVAPSSQSHQRYAMPQKRKAEDIDEGDDGRNELRVAKQSSKRTYKNHLVFNPNYKLVPVIFSAIEDVKKSLRPGQKNPLVSLYAIVASIKSQDNTRICFELGDVTKKTAYKLKCVFWNMGEDLQFPSSGSVQRFIGQLSLEKGSLLLQVYAWKEVKSQRELRSGTTEH